MSVCLAVCVCVCVRVRVRVFVCVCLIAQTGQIAEDLRFFKNTKGSYASYTYDTIFVLRTQLSQCVLRRVNTFKMSFLTNTDSISSLTYFKWCGTLK